MAKRGRLLSAGIVVCALGLFIAFWAVVINRTSGSGYWLADERTLVVQVTSGTAAACRITETVETVSEVRVTAACLDLSIGPGIALGKSYDLRVSLAAPLGGRPVIDGYDGHELPFVRCHDGECTPRPIPSGSQAP